MNEQQERIREFFLQNSDVYDMGDGENGETNIETHKIDTIVTKRLSQHHFALTTACAEYFNKEGQLSITLD